MKLIKCIATKGEDGENVHASTLEMMSDDLNELKSKANDLCRLMGFEPSLWTSRYPVPGNNEIKSNKEWVMNLDNGIVFVIDE